MIAPLIQVVLSTIKIHANYRMELDSYTLIKSMMFMSTTDINV